MSRELEKAIIAVRKSPVREEIVRELAVESNLRPSEIFDRIKDRTETSKENFYQNLNALSGFVVDRVEGSRRMTLYSLTDIGREAADELGLTKSEHAQLRRFAFQSSLSAEEIEEILSEVKEEKEE